MMVMMMMLCPTQTTLWSQFVLQFYSAPRNPLAVFKGPTSSDVTMGWLLRLVTGALVVEGPRQF